MGILDSLFGSFTYAESQRNKFQQLVSYLSEKIGELSTYIDDAREELKKIHKPLVSNPDSAEGKIITEFDRKQSEWHREGVDLINRMQQAESDLNGKLQEAQQKYEYWCEAVRREKEEEERRLLAAQQSLDNQ